MERIVSLVRTRLGSKGPDQWISVPPVVNGVNPTTPGRTQTRYGRPCHQDRTHPIWSRPLDPPIHPKLILIGRHRRRAPAAAAFLHHLAALAPTPHTEDPD